MPWIEQQDRAGRDPLSTVRVEVSATHTPRRGLGRSAAAFLVACAVSVCGGGCAGYQIGAQSLYPAHIHTVYVPIFESSSFRRNLGEQLTEAVQKRIEATTPYKVVGRSDADSVLSGRIIGETKRVVVGSTTGEAREVQVDLQVEVGWVDRRGAMIRQTQSIPLPTDVTNVGGSATFVPEIGQSVATAQQEAIGRVAQQIVGLMEAPW